MSATVLLLIKDTQNEGILGFGQKKHQVSVGQILYLIYSVKCLASETNNVALQFSLFLALT